MRMDVFAALQAVNANIEADVRDAESQRLLAHMLRDGRRAGLHLSEPIQRRIHAITRELSELRAECMSAFAHDTTFLRLAAKELDGIPASAIATFDADQQLGDAMYKIDLQVRARPCG